MPAQPGLGGQISDGDQTADVKLRRRIRAVPLGAQRGNPRVELVPGQHTLFNHDLGQRSRHLP